MRLFHVLFTPSLLHFPAATAPPPAARHVACSQQGKPTEQKGKHTRFTHSYAGETDSTENARRADAE